MKNIKNIIDIFLRRNLISQDLADSLVAQNINSLDELIAALEENGLIYSSDNLWQIVAMDLGAEYIDLQNVEPTQELLDLVPSSIARLYGVLPINFAEDGVTLVIVCLDPLDIQSIEDFQFSVDCPVEIVIADSKVIEEKIAEFYPEQKQQDGINSMDKSNDDLELSAEDIESEANSAPIIRYVDLILLQAFKDKASDIHFEPFEKEFRIRYRVDGLLQEVQSPPLKLALPVISRIKVLSNLNIAESRLPQDGRLMKVIDGKQVDMRVSTLPTQHGESVVLRILDSASVSLTLEELGLPKKVDNYIQESISRPNGIFIVTGPTGAGKTTTLYAALRKINNDDTKILTVEDPVEYEVDGIMQVPVNEAIGLSFPSVLRAFLRQDPDKILVGEIRDEDTARIAIQASLTGHLVLSTLHTNDAAGTISRLLDMDLEPFLVAASLTGILAQRLVKKICPKCRSSYQPSEMLLSQMDISIYDIGDKEFYTGVGCDECKNTGYSGRQGLFELLKIDDSISKLIIERAPTLAIKKRAIELGMTTLRQDGLSHIYNGTTTIEEVMKYT